MYFCQRKCQKKGIDVILMVFGNFNLRCQIDFIDFQSQLDWNFKDNFYMFCATLSVTKLRYVIVNSFQEI